MPPVTVDRLTRDEAQILTTALDSWTAPDSSPAGLHSGDVGWLLRLDDDFLRTALYVVHEAAEVVAVAIKDGPDVLRPAMRPDRLHDGVVADALASLCDTLPRDSAAYTDAPSGSALRARLSRAGWELDSDPWVCLYRPLAPEVGGYDDPSCARLADDRDVQDRVAVQRAAFDGSTFTAKRWRQMARGPGYEPSYDLLRRIEDGIPVAAATGWSAGPGKCAILEPVGVSPDHMGKGHGKAISIAMIAGLARAGASGVAVWTPASNVAAVKTYEACGLRQVELATSMRRLPH